MTGWQPITCEVVRPTEGHVRPRAFTWQDRRLAIDHIGRRWDEDDGRHLLVRVFDGRVFELRHDRDIWHACLRVSPLGIA